MWLRGRNVGEKKKKKLFLSPPPSRGTQDSYPTYLKLALSTSIIMLCLFHEYESSLLSLFCPRALKPVLPNNISINVWMETCRLICQLLVFAIYFYILALPGPVLPRPLAVPVPAIATYLGCSPVLQLFPAIFLTSQSILLLSGTFFSESPFTIATGKENKSIGTKPVRCETYMKEITKLYWRIRFEYLKRDKNLVWKIQTSSI